MALSHSPSVVTNGLVYYHDMNNTKKSWKGAPVTNLFITNPDFSQGLTGYSAYAITPTITTTTDVPSTLNISRNVLNCATAAVFGGGGNYGGAFFNFPTLTVNTTYTFSFYARSLSGNMNVMFSNQSGAGDNSNLSFSSTVTSAWQRFSVSASLNLIKPYGYLYNTSLASGIFQVADIQLEANAFATPYVNGTRTNTQALVDIIGKNTVTAASLTYASDGTFSFNGTTDNATSVLSYQFLTTGFSVIIFFKYTQTTTNDNLISWGNAAFNAGSAAAWEIRIRGAASVEFSPGLSVGGVSAPTRLSYAPSTALNGRIACITVTYIANGLASIYENGVLQATNNYAGVGVNAATNTLNIGHGTDTYFPGNIYAVKLYNKALSAAEVTQNFNALKGRYGL